MKETVKDIREEGKGKRDASWKGPGRLAGEGAQAEQEAELAGQRELLVGKGAGQGRAWRVGRSVWLGWKVWVEARMEGGVSRAPGRGHSSKMLACP